MLTANQDVKNRQNNYIDDDIVNIQNLNSVIMNYEKPNL